MIKKLRIKFICINMLIVTVMLAVLLGTLTQYIQRSMVKDRYTMMHRVAEEPGRKVRPSADGEESVYPPYFILEHDPNGELLAYGNSGFDLSDREQMQTLYDRACALEAPEGVLEDFELRYVRVETPRGTKLVLADMSSERTMTRYLVRLSSLVGFGGFALFFVISLLLSGWAVKPVDEAWRQQKQFVADASHELKTPLTVIMANAELLQQPGYDEAQRRVFSESILSMSRQMRQLVESLLNLARLDSMRKPEGMEALDFSTLVEDCILPFEPLYFERGLLLESEIEPGLTVCGNERALCRCVDILLDNAQKYSEPGSVKLRLQRNGRTAELTVSNPSPELTRSECRDVFKRFYRRDEARTGSGSYGLGLPIAEGIVRGHGGRISCDWEAGEIRFTVTIPVCQ